MADQRRDPEQRPSPEALLEAARREDSRAGRLKIFVGAAPGVGKTYEMLQSAHAKRKAGVDVVVGVVETHGRAETEALLDGLEVVPRRRLEYKGQALEEMDLDALIARRPQIALVDELAHTNAPGSRHPKRYLDVEELLSPRHRRLHRRQHPAHREPQRRGRADHPCARARDRAGFGLRPRRRHRAGRPHAGRPDPAPEGRQGLRPEAGRARARALFLAGQPDGAARAGAAAHRRARRRAAAHPHAGPRHRRPVGGGRAHPGLHQRGSARGRPRALHQAAGGPAARAVDRALHRDAAQPATDRRAARPARRYAAAGRGARRRGGDHSRRRPPHRRRRHRLCARQQRHPDHHRQVDAARAGSRSCTARWCTIWCGAPAISACSDRRRRAAAEPIAKTDGAAPRRAPSRSIPSPICWRSLVVAIGARRRPS